MTQTEHDHLTDDVFEEEAEFSPSFSRQADPQVSTTVRTEKRITRSLTEVLPYWGIEEGVVILTDGTAEIGIELRPDPVVFQSPGELHSTWTRVKQVLRLGVPQRQRARFIVESAPARETLIRGYHARKTPGGRLQPDVMPMLGHHAHAHEGGAADTRGQYPLIQEMVNLRAQAFKEMRKYELIMEHRYFLTCTVPSGKRKDYESFDEQELAELLDSARKVRDSLTARLRGAGMRPAPMSSQETFELMWRYFNPEHAATRPPRYLPESGRTYVPERVLKQHPEIDLPTTRRQIVSSNLESHRGQMITVGNRWTRTITLSRLPDTSYVNSIDNVVRALGHRHSYVMIDYQHEPYAQTLRKLTMKLRSTKSSNEMQEYGQLDSSSGVIEAEQARMIEHLSRSNEHIFYTSCNLVVFGDSPQDVAVATQDALEAISYLGSTMPVVGDVSTLEIYIKENAPFSGKMARSKFMVVETTSADFFPLTSPWRGSKEPMSLFRNQLGGLVGIDYFDRECSSWNGLICGGMGSGKTFLAQSIIRDMLAEGVRVVIIDRGLGYSPMVEGVGGEIVMMEPNKNVSINPFQLIAGDLPEPEEVNQIRMILSAMVELSDDKEQRAIENSLITAAIEKAFSMKTSTRRVNGESIDSTETVFVHDFRLALGRLDNLDGQDMTQDLKNVASRLAARYTRWVGNTPEALLVDRPTNVNLNSPIILFDTQGLDANPDIARVTLVLLTNLVLKNAYLHTGSRKALFIDEAWALFKHPQAQEMILDVSRRARRYDLAFYGISQSAGDFLAIPGMVDQINYMFIGKDAGNREMLLELPGMTETGVQFQQSIGIQKGQYSEFLALIRKQTSREGDLIRVEAQGMEYWVFTTVGEEMKRRQDLAEARGISLADAARLLAT